MNKPTYDKDALLKAIGQMKEQVAMFEAEITKIEGRIVQYQALAKDTEQNGNTKL